MGSLFCGHERTFENFCRPSTDPKCKLPPGSPLEVEAIYQSHLIRWLFLTKNHNLKHSFLVSFGFGMLCGAGGTYMWLLEAYQDSVDLSWGEEPSRVVYNNLIEPLAEAAK